MLIGGQYTGYDFGIRYGCYASIVIFTIFFLKWPETAKKLIKIMFYTGFIFGLFCCHYGLFFIGTKY